MKLLLDTHVLVWWFAEPERIGKAVFQHIENPQTTVLVSAVSGYEIELKRRRDPALARVPEALEAAVVEDRMSWLAVGPAHMIAAAQLPLHHRDPWDRILVAQAMLEDALLISADRWVSAYDVRAMA